MIQIIGIIYSVLLNQLMHGTYLIESFTSMIFFLSSYFLLSTSSEDTARTYFTARKYGFISEKYVWMGMTFPSTSASFGSLASEYGQSTLSDLIGYIAVAPTFSTSETKISELNELWKKLHNAQPDRFIASGILSTQAVLAYDLTNAMLYGLDRFLKNNPNVSSNSLLNGDIQYLLKPSVFSNTSKYFLAPLFRLLIYTIRRLLKVTRAYSLIVLFLTAQGISKRKSTITVFHQTARAV
jgi:hypothetical protein